MTLVAINAVVDVSRHLIMLEVVGIVSAVTPRALEDGVVVRIYVTGRANIVGAAVIRWELRVLRVIKCGARPCCGVVTGLARGREELRLRGVAGISRVVVVGLMASDAGCRQRRVVVVDVAIRALPRRHRMRSGQGEGCVVVIKG